MKHQGVILYKYSGSTGKLLEWSCHVEGADVVTITGEQGGKLQEHRYTAGAKNVGRSNETTARAQAYVELSAHYKDQEDNKHYRVSVEEAAVVRDTARIPRKVYNYKDHGHKLPHTCLSSYKANGSRACILDGQLYSKIGRHEDIKVQHLKDVVHKLNLHGLANFDAEVYAHGLSLQRIRSAWLKPVKTDKEVIKVAKDRLKQAGKAEEVKDIKTADDAVISLGYNPNDDQFKLKLYIFDIPVIGVPFIDRLDRMRELQDKVWSLRLDHCIEFLLPSYTHGAEEREAIRDDAVSNGWEGLVHYSPNDMYEFDKRAMTAQKDKPRYDAEAFVVGVEKCKNGDGKLLLKACDELNNVPFKAMMKVERRDGLKYPRDYDTMQELIGNWITFSYEELSEKGVPTKPVGEMVRKCNDRGEPLE